MKTVTHDNVTFNVETITIETAHNGDVIKYQASYGNDGMMLSEIEENEAIAIMTAIACINKNRDRFLEEKPILEEIHLNDETIILSVNNSDLEFDAVKTSSNIWAVYNRATNKKILEAVQYSVVKKELEKLVLEEKAATAKFKKIYC